MGGGSKALIRQATACWLVAISILAGSASAQDAGPPTVEQVAPDQAAGEAPPANDQPSEWKPGDPPLVVKEVHHTRVTGGRRAPAGSAPFQAQLYWSIPVPPEKLLADQRLPDGHEDKQYFAQKDAVEQAHSCGGALIAFDWVLTAAHCVNSPNYPFLTTRRVRLGTQDLRSGGATFRIDRAAIHTNWTQDNKRDDIALLHIVYDAQTGPVPISSIAPIRILGSKPGDRPLQGGDEVTVTGWGLTKVQGVARNALARDRTINHTASQLQVLTSLYVFDKKVCAAFPRYADKLYPSTICVGAFEAGKDSCSGDSGGPLTRYQDDEKVLVGLVSWGLGCGLKGVPGIYTDVTQYADWIKRAKRVPVGKVTPVR